MKTTERRSLAVEDRDLAQQIGARLKAARLRAGLTQQQVAAGRYTKAYVSALENGLIKPSMAALRFLAVRLGTTPSELLADADQRWARMEAELRLAAGDWQAAVDRFSDLLDGEPQGLERARVLVGLAEGYCRLGRATEAIRFASEADERFTRSGLRDEARRARYWLAGAHHLSDNPDEARRLFEQLLAEDSEAAPLGPDFRVRVLVALAAVMTQAGQPRRALSLLEEARGIGADIDDRRRAALLSSLALGYRATGDMEAAMRSGLQSLALYQAADAVLESASVENELALIYLGLGNVKEARSHVTVARTTFEAGGNDFLLAHVAETEARIDLAEGRPDAAAEKAAAAGEMARRTGNRKAEISALVTAARAARSAGDGAAAAATLAKAAKLARSGPRPRLREILSEWSELLAETGDHQRAYELSREALTLV
ncbi:MAG TPA: helix-turn-helix domain-containing protein [Candidatus Limnocylindrales bacterium]|nr:helix-turn-helix domain-containing protein [Candidatus Limnocylindrales bacterium]